MNAEWMFRLMLFLLLASFMLHRGLQTRRHSPGEERVDRELNLGPTAPIANLLVLIALLSSLAFMLFPSLIAFAAFGLPAWARWLALPVALAGFALMTWAQRTLGRNWSDTPVQLRGHTLVSDGPYRWVRHPMYTAFLMILSTPLLITANWLVGLAWIVGTGLDIRARMRAEESMLQATFGSAYTEQAAKTGRLLPRIGA